MDPLWQSAEQSLIFILELMSPEKNINDRVIKTSSTAQYLDGRFIYVEVEEATRVKKKKIRYVKIREKSKLMIFSI